MTNEDLVRCCPSCEAENHKDAWKCICGHNISNRDPQLRRASMPIRTDVDTSIVTLAKERLRTAHAVTEKSPRCVIELVDNPSVRFTILDGQVVGSGLRIGDTPDVCLRGFPNIKMISSRMARFYRRRDQWYIQLIGKNWISVNDGECVTDDAALAIENDSIVNLVYTRFRVAIAE